MLRSIAMASRISASMKAAPVNATLQMTQVRTYIYEVKVMDKKINLRLNEFQVLKDAPVLEELADDQYPSWLWTITKPLPSMYDLQKVDAEDLVGPLLRRHFKLTRKNLIKDKNAASKK